MSSKYHVVGTCDKCFGPVVMWIVDGSVPQIPKCQWCGAKKIQEPFGPVVKMDIKPEISEEFPGAKTIC